MQFSFFERTEERVGFAMTIILFYFFLLTLSSPRLHYNTTKKVSLGVSINRKLDSGETACENFFACIGNISENFEKR